MCLLHNTLPYLLKLFQDDNIMVTSESNGSLSVKLIDFGLSHFSEDPSEKQREMNELLALIR